MWRFILVFLSCIALCAWSSANAVTWSRSINNAVTGTLIHHTWDPADPLTISGTLLDNQLENCPEGNPAANVDEVQVNLVPADPNHFTPAIDTHLFCNGTPPFTFSGTDANGDYSIPLGTGGGVSWLTGDGTQYTAAWLKLTFKEGTSEWYVACGDASKYPLPGCVQAPTVYGVLASPDLVPDGMVTAGDWTAFTSLLYGEPAGDVCCWQGNFNHEGVNVDASDAAYMVARLGESCSSQKVGSVDYDADIRNLDLDYVETFLNRHGITKAQILAYWDEFGFSYDRSLAGNILSEPGADPASWTTVKKLYR